MKIDEITSTFQCLMDVTRLRMVRLLVGLADEDVAEVCVGDFVSSLGEPQYNVSKQLKILELAGVLVSRKEGRHVYFRLARGALVEGLFSLVAELPDSERVFSKDAKKLDKQLKSQAGRKKVKKVKKLAKKSEVRKKERKSPVVSPPRELREMDLPSNLL